jgi:hypothetical protein
MKIVVIAWISVNVNVYVYSCCSFIYWLTCLLAKDQFCTNLYRMVKLEAHAL